MIKKNFLIFLLVIFILTSLSFGVFASPIAPENTTEATTQISAEESSSAEVPEDTTVSDEGTTISGEETTAVAEETTAGEDAVTDEETTAVAEETTAGEDAVTDEETTVENTDKAGLSISKLEIILYACVAAAAVLVILIVVLIVLLIKLKNKKKEIGDKPRKVKTVDGKSGGSVAPAASASVKKSVSVNIPEGTPEAIDVVFGLEQSEAPVDTGYASNEASAPKAAPAVQKTSLDEIQAQLMKLYDGTMKSSDFTEKVSLLVVSNIYEISVSNSIAPIFAITDNASSARFAVVADKYLYINFHVYCKGDFKLYSDLEGVDRCFDINMSGNRIPYGSVIKSISPAKVELVNNTYTLTEKGKIVVEL